MDTLMTLTVDDQTRVVVEFDRYYETRGSYGLDTEEETKAAEDHEIEMLNRGVWDAVQLTLQKRCPCCNRFDDVDTLGGWVGEVTSKSMVEAARENFGVEVK